MTAHVRPPEDLRARLLAAASREPATRPGTWRRRALACGLLAVVWMSVVTGLLGFRDDLGQLPFVGLVQTVLVLVGIAGAASMIGVARGRSMVGASSEYLLTSVVLLPLVLLVVVSVIDPMGPTTHLFPGLQATLEHSVRCDLLVTAVALPLVGFGWAMARGLTLARPALSGACVGLGAATWAHAVVRVHCSIGGGGHGIVAHLLPALPLMLLAAWAFTVKQSAP